MTETEEITEALTIAITRCKRQALNEFIKHLMPVLKQNNRDIKHVIDARSGLRRSKRGLGNSRQVLRGCFRRNQSITPPLVVKLSTDRPRTET